MLYEQVDYPESQNWETGMQEFMKEGRKFKCTNGRYIARAQSDSRCPFRRDCSRQEDFTAAQDSSAELATCPLVSITGEAGSDGTDGDCCYFQTYNFSWTELYYKALSVSIQILDCIVQTSLYDLNVSFALHLNPWGIQMRNSFFFFF